MPDEAIVSSQKTNNISIASKPKVNFRSPKRAYKKIWSDWNIYVEKSIYSGDPQLADEAIEKLEDNLELIFDILPIEAARNLETIDFYLLWGTDVPEGGRKSGLSYIRDGEPRNYRHLDTRWNDAVIIYSAKNLVYLSDLWTRKALVHELAHAWHITNWPDKHPPIYNAYKSANRKGLYQNIVDNKNKKISRAYAIKNQLEYFAELSAIFLLEEIITRSIGPDSWNMIVPGRQW
ncbi:MAG: hypothetical protein NXI13_10980 [Proteobacteria bacterium]|nr:hypothetical protein [Pseudomonadota bacterium]